MLRIIVRIEDAAKAANVGGNVDTTYRTFDVELPELERCLGPQGAYGHAQVIGAEVLREPPPSPPAGKRREGAS